MKADGRVPVFVTSEGGVEAYGAPGPIRVGGTLSMFEMDLGHYWSYALRGSVHEDRG